MVIADFYNRAAIYTRDRDLETNAFSIPWGGTDFRTPFFPGQVPGPFGFVGLRLIPKLFFSATPAASLSP